MMVRPVVGGNRANGHVGDYCPCMISIIHRPEGQREWTGGSEPPRDRRDGAGKRVSRTNVPLGPPTTIHHNMHRQAVAASDAYVLLVPELPRSRRPACFFSPSILSHISYSHSAAIHIRTNHGNQRHSTLVECRRVSSDKALLHLPAAPARTSVSHVLHPETLPTNHVLCM